MVGKVMEKKECQHFEIPGATAECEFGISLFLDRFFRFLSLA